MMMRRTRLPASAGSWIAARVNFQTRSKLRASGRSRPVRCGFILTCCCSGRPRPMALLLCVACRPARPPHSRCAFGTPFAELHRPTSCAGSRPSGTVRPSGTRARSCFSGRRSPRESVFGLFTRYRGPLGAFASEKRLSADAFSQARNADLAPCRVSLGTVRWYA